MTIASILFNFELMGVLLFGKLITKEVCVRIRDKDMQVIFIQKVAVVRTLIGEFKTDD